MSSPDAERAISDCLAAGKALLKTISANDAGLTGSHQSGFYLPKAAHSVFTPFPPTPDQNYDHRVTAVWPDGTKTDSTVKWYGVGTRSEYRLTGFNEIRHFQFKDPDTVGSLLLLVPMATDYFHMHVLDREDEIDDVLGALGADLTRGWDVFDASAPFQTESENTCLQRKFNDYAASLREFPSTQRMSDETIQTLTSCIPSFHSKLIDDRLMRSVEEEYNLFLLVERKLCEPDVIRVFQSIDDFLQTAQTILQRRKSRAGKSFENHVRRILTEAEIPFDPNPRVDGTEPDILIPGKSEYEDAGFPIRNLVMVGVKTTCKDRWRQILQEAPRVSHRYILTLQHGVTINQLNQMEQEGVKLVVPRKLVRHFPESGREKILTVEAFVSKVSSQLGL